VFPSVVRVAFAVQLPAALADAEERCSVLRPGDEARRSEARATEVHPAQGHRTRELATEPDVVDVPLRRDIRVVQVSGELDGETGAFAFLAGVADARLVATDFC
jgi:hypothetical protein